MLCPVPTQILCFCKISPLGIVVEPAVSAFGLSLGDEPPRYLCRQTQAGPEQRHPLGRRQPRQRENLAVEKQAEVTKEEVRNSLGARRGTLFPLCVNQ